MANGRQRRRTGRAIDFRRQHHTRAISRHFPKFCCVFVRHRFNICRFYTYPVRRIVVFRLLLVNRQLKNPIENTSVYGFVRPSRSHHEISQVSQRNRLNLKSQAVAGVWNFTRLGDDLTNSPCLVDIHQLILLNYSKVR